MKKLISVLLCTLLLLMPVTSALMEEASEAPVAEDFLFESDEDLAVEAPEPEAADDEFIPEPIDEDLSEVQEALPEAAGAPEAEPAPEAEDGFDGEYAVEAPVDALTIDGNGVVTAFDKTLNYNAIDVPEGVTAIAASVFAASDLVYITLPSTLTSIGTNAFDGCKSLATCNLPAAVTEIGENAFRGCEKLTSMAVPSGVSILNAGTFSGCSGLTSVTLPDGLLIIRSDAFNGCAKLTSVALPARLSNIEANAFANCASLGGISIPDSVYGLGEGAFSGCKALATATLSPNLPRIEPSTFEGCASLGAIVLPDKIESVGDKAFKDCVKLATATLNNGLKALGKEAFNGCAGLQEIVLPDSVTAVGEGAFSGCSTMKSFTFGNGMATIPAGLLVDCRELTTLVIPEKITEITDYAFYDLPALKSVSLPKSLLILGDYAFYYCISLRAVELPTRMTKLGQYAFAHCHLLEKANLPLNLGAVPEGIFSNCQHLEKIDLHSGITTIGSMAFYNCNGLKEIILPTSVSVIENYAFSGCNNVASVEIPNSVTSIGFRAFADCAYLEKVVLAYGLIDGSLAGWVEGGTDSGEIFDSCPMLVLNVYPESYAEKYAKKFFTKEHIKVLDFIQPQPKISECTVAAIPDQKYTGSDITPDVVVTSGETKLVRGTDYTVSYSNNIAAGEAKVTIKGMGSYTGEKTVPFKIIASADPAPTTPPAPVIVDLKDCSVAAIADQTYNGNDKTPAVTVKNGTTTLVRGTDYTVSYEDNQNVGTATVTIKGMGSYTGTRTATFKILPPATKISKLTKGSKRFTVTWKKKTTQVTGYQIQYSTSEDFDTRKTVTVKNAKTTSKTIKNLKKKKTYYVRVRTYKTVDGKKYYSEWSAVKSVKTR